MKLKKVSFEIIKTDAGELVVKKPDKVNKQLDDLVPGIYKAIIEKEDTELIALKKYYFKCESSLAQYIGADKRDLHEDLKSHIGFKTDEETGLKVYESISSIKDMATMMNRVHELHQWAAKEFKYTFEPFSGEESKKLST